METIALTELLDMPSHEAPRYGNTKVREMLDLKRSDEFYPELVESMREHGLEVPVLVIDGCCYNGHHRIAAAQDLGWTEVPCTADGAAGCTDNWPNGVEPKSWTWPGKES